MAYMINIEVFLKENWRFFFNILRYLYTNTSIVAVWAFTPYSLFSLNLSELVFFFKVLLFSYVG